MDTSITVPQPDAQDAFDVIDVWHRNVLTYLEKLTELVQRLQAASPDEEVRGTARDVIAFFSGPTREHNNDVERHVFPTLLQCDDAQVRQAARCLQEHHAWIELYWLDIEPQLKAVTIGVSSSDHKTLGAAVDEFVELMREYIALEKPLLYPQLQG